MKSEKIIIFFLILTFICSTVSAANITGSVINTSNNYSNESQTSQIRNETNETNTTNQTISNATRDALIHNVSVQMTEISNYANGTNLSVIAEYSGQNLEKLKNDISNSTMNNQTKKKILLNVNLAIQTNNQAVTAVINGNTALAKSKMQYEKTVINTIKTQIANEKGKTIDNDLADNLTQKVNSIQTAQANGGEWILNNTEHFNFTSTKQFYENIETKTDSLKNTIQQLKDGGVQMDVRTVDASDLQSNGDGTYTLKNTTKTNSNGTVKAKAVIPILVLFFAAGVVIEINNAVMAAISTDVAIEYILKTHPGELVCGDCRFRIYALNLLGLTGGTIVTWGISIYAMDTVVLMSYGLAIIDYASFVSDFSGQVLATVFIRTDELMSDGCEEQSCVFFKNKKRDLVGTLELPYKIYVNEENNITATIFNTKYGNINSSFKVTLYENSTTGPDPENFTPIATQTVSGLEGKSNTTVNFNWVPTYHGQHVLKLVVDSHNEINETNEENNNAIKYAAADDYINYLTLYNVEKINSTTDPSQYSKVVYYFAADHPINLQPGVTPIFIYETSNPIYSDVGFQAFYPYGAMWQEYSNTPNINGTWYSCFTNPYQVCEANVTEYRKPHNLQGSGHYQYFRVIMKTQPVWLSGIVKTDLLRFGVIEKAP